MVVDQRSLEPLAGAYVVRIGTQLGTATNERGEYVVGNIPAGSYDVRVYHPDNALAVLADVGVATRVVTSLTVALPEDHSPGCVVYECSRPVVAIYTTATDSSTREPIPSESVGTGSDTLGESLVTQCPPADTALTVYATVADASTRQPIPGARITIVPDTILAITDALGAAVFERVPVGRYDLTIAAEGFHRVTYPQFSLYCFRCDLTLNLTLTPTAVSE